MRKFHAVAVADALGPVYYNELASSVMFQVDNDPTFYRYIDDITYMKAVEITKGLNLLEETNS